MDEQRGRARVVVGVDGSAGSRRALRWAAEEAERRGADLTVVTVWQWDGVDAVPLAGASPLEAERMSAELLDAEVAALPDPSVVTTRLVARGGAGAALVEASREADLLVLGSHGHGALHAAVLGSVSQYCVRHVECPVVILPLPRTAKVPRPTPTRQSRGGATPVGPLM